MPTVTTADQVALHVDDEGGGPVVALVGGFAMASTGWHSVRRALLDRGHRVVSVDRRSHGRSQHVTHGQTMRRHGQDIGDVLEALDLSDVVLVGASMGASAAWAYIDELGTGRLAGVVSVDQTPAMLPADGWDHGMTGLDHNTLDEFIATFPGTLNPLHRMPEPDLLALMRPDEPAPIDDLRGLLRDHATADWRPVIARVDVPVLAVAGRQSPFWPWQHAQAIAALAPDGSSVVIEDCGHVPFLEQPAELARVLRRFVAEVTDP